jgi:hypothetical protein
MAENSVIANSSAPLDSPTSSLTGVVKRSSTNFQQIRVHSKHVVLGLKFFINNKLCLFFFKSKVLSSRQPVVYSTQSRISTRSSLWMKTQREKLKLSAKRGRPCGTNTLTCELPGLF